MKISALYIERYSIYIYIYKVSNFASRANTIKMLFCKFRYTSFYVIIITDKCTILITGNFSFLRWRAINICINEVSNFINSDANANTIKTLFCKFLIIIDKHEILFMCKISNFVDHSVETVEK